MDDRISVVPDLIAAIVSKATAAAEGNDEDHPLYGRYVEDGYGTSNGAYADVLMVGVEDPQTDDANSAETTEELAFVGPAVTRDEKGYVTCLAMSDDGGGNQKAARDAAYRTAMGVAMLLAADYQLGVTGLLWTVVGSRTRLNQGQDSDRGAVALLTFRIYFEARL
ncbi:hypothetical protein GCM10009795_040020 [Nocardioides hankookensis]|uniref:DUF3168 domain-containing protein n=1 Tax=Nocardioides hankookensis TaxID=443157 RepID=A0ABW1LRE4_9ACTN